MKKNIGIRLAGTSLVSTSYVIGSGKISRRVTITPYKKFENIRRPHRAKSPIVTSVFHRPKKTKRIKFPDESTKIVFLYWNRLGHPFVHHREVWNKTTARGIERIKKAVKQNNRDDVVKAIHRLHNLFTWSQFRYRLYFAKKKITLPKFFHYDSNELQMIRSKLKSCPSSWFKESLKGKEYLEQKYGVLAKDRNPGISKRLISIWNEYQNSDSLSNGERNNLVKASRIVKEFAKVNDFDSEVVLDVIEGMLNKWKTFKPKHSGYLKNSIFWEEQFPKELERYGLVEDAGNVRNR